MRFRFFIPVLIILSACSLPQPEQAEPVPQPEVDSSFEAELQFEVAPQFPEPEVAHPAQVEPEPEPPELEPDSLIGIDQDNLIKQFGTPDYERLEGRVRILQYRLTPCVVDFVVMDEKVTAWAGRHRHYGAVYHHRACTEALAQHTR